jgi:hypothetical protein
VWVVHELHAGGFVEQRHLANEESDGVQPGKKNARDNVPDTFLTEAQIFTPHNGRVNQEHPGTQVSFKVACITELTPTS